VQHGIARKHATHRAFESLEMAESGRLKLGDRRPLTRLGFGLPTSSYHSQTKVLEGVTRDEMRMFDALFKVVRTLFGPLTIEKYIEHPHFISCYSVQNLRLGTQWGLIWGA
jgi:hypothetical protein